MTIRPFDLADLDALIQIQNATTPMHKLSAPEFVRDMETLSPELQRMIQVAEIDGEVVGFSIAERLAGMYHPQKFHLTLAVTENHRGGRIGTALYRTTEDHLRTLDVLSISTQVAESNELGLKFAADRGYEEQKRDFVSYLDITKFQPTLFVKDVLGIEFKTFSEMDSPQHRREWYDLFCIVRHDVPRSSPPTPIEFEFFDEQVINEPDFAPDLTIFAFDGDRMVGFTGGYVNRETGIVDQWLTAVHRDYRGRGVAMAVKVRQLEAAQRAGLKRIQTDNDSRNAPMLAVNERLGFERQPAVLSLRKDF